MPPLPKAATTAAAHVQATNTVAFVSSAATAATDTAAAGEAENDADADADAYDNLSRSGRCRRWSPLLRPPPMRTPTPVATDDNDLFGRRRYHYR